jgi:hypothetical protein
VGREKEGADGLGREGKGSDSLLRRERAQTALGVFDESENTRLYEEGELRSCVW